MLRGLVYRGRKHRIPCGQKGNGPYFQCKKASEVIEWISPYGRIGEASLLPPSGTPSAYCTSTTLTEKKKRKKYISDFERWGLKPFPPK